MTMDNVKIGNSTSPRRGRNNSFEKNNLTSVLVASLCIVVIMHVVGGGGGMQSSVLAAHNETAWCTVSCPLRHSSYGCEHCEQWVDIQGHSVRMISVRGL